MRVPYIQLNFNIQMVHLLHLEHPIQGPRELIYQSITRQVKRYLDSIFERQTGLMQSKSLRIGNGRCGWVIWEEVTEFSKWFHLKDMR